MENVTQAPDARDVASARTAIARGPSGGEVVSVNVGTLRQIRWRGRLLSTGIWKYPVEGRVEIRGTSLSGDIQADPESHGGPRKAVYSYSIEDYRWWEQTLGIKLQPGTFGENLTLSGIDLGGVLVGERWRVGTTNLRVTQPRIPCFKLGIRMDDRRFPRRFSEAERPGAYLAVEHEGDVGTGDPVEIVERPSHPITVRMLAHLDYNNRRLAQLVAAAVEVGMTPAEWSELTEVLELPREYLGSEFV
jgi:MOSC domain-containing protein YiiM